MPLLLTNSQGRIGIEAARRVLLDGGSALDAVEQGVSAVEADQSVDSVGRGGHPRLTGEVECDAAVMDGLTLRVGAVAALRGFLHPVSVARQVLERLPHVLLVGPGAERFAAEIGAERADLLTDETRRRHDDWLRLRVRPADLKKWPGVPLAQYAWLSAEDYVGGGTTLFIAADAEGNTAVATSTSGWPRSYPGRVGDTPIVGAGLYCDNRFGACGCTHTGEMALRAGTAHSVLAYIRTGLSVREACLSAVRDLSDLAFGILGPLVVHATDFYGNPCVVATAELGDKSEWYFWDHELAVPERRSAEIIGDGSSRGST